MAWGASGGRGLDCTLQVGHASSHGLFWGQSPFLGRYWGSVQLGFCAFKGSSVVFLASQFLHMSEASFSSSPQTRSPHLVWLCPRRPQGLSFPALLHLRVRPCGLWPGFGKAFWAEKAWSLAPGGACLLASLNRASCEPAPSCPSYETLPASIPPPPRQAPESSPCQAALAPEVLAAPTARGVLAAGQALLGSSCA